MNRGIVESFNCLIGVCIQQFHDSTIPRLYSTILPRFNNSTTPTILTQFNDSTIPQFNNSYSTIPQLNKFFHEFPADPAD